MLKKKLSNKLAILESKVSAYDEAILEIITAIKQLMQSPEPKKRSIGSTAKF